jgi:hypothetical protein
MGQSQSDEKSVRSSGDLTQAQKDELSLARSRVAQEIYETEKVYVKRLEALIKLYKKPLLRAVEDKRALIPLEAINSIFSNVEEILGFQEKLLYDLEGRVNKWTTKSLIADIFIKNADGLKLYVTYINNYDNALQTIHAHSKENAKFKEFLRESVTREAGDQQDILSLLITVVQRPPRYCLLLKELLKHTPDSHKDKSPLTEALAAMESAADYINTQKMIAEGHARSIKLKSMFQNKFSFTPTTRAIICEQDIKAVKRGKLLVVLFDNYLLVGEEKTNWMGRGKSKYEPVVWCPLESVTINPASDTTLTVAFNNTSSDSPSSSSNSTPAIAAATSPAASSSSSSSSSGKSSPTLTPSSSSAAPTVIITVPNLVFTWENHEPLQAWMAMVLEAQSKLQNKKQGRSRGQSILSFFKW